MSENKPTSIFKKIGNLLYVLFIVLCLGISIFVVLNKDKSDKNGTTILGYKSYVVLTGSMAPTFDAGSLIISKEVPIEKIKVKDIVTYHSKSDELTLITHRVVDIKNQNGNISLITRGDANNTNDPDVESDRFVGKTVFYLNGVGNIVIQFQNTFFVVCVFVLVVLILALPYLVKTKKK